MILPFAFVIPSIWISPSQLLDQYMLLQYSLYEILSARNYINITFCVCCTLYLNFSPSLTNTCYCNKAATWLNTPHGDTTLCLGRRAHKTLETAPAPPFRGESRAVPLSKCRIRRIPMWRWGGILLWAHMTFNLSSFYVTASDERTDERLPYVRLARDFSVTSFFVHEEKKTFGNFHIKP